MLHFVPLTFFMQHSFAFIFFFRRLLATCFALGDPGSILDCCFLLISQNVVSFLGFMQQFGMGFALHCVRKGEGDRGETRFTQTSGKGYYISKTDNTCSEFLNFFKVVFVFFFLARTAFLTLFSNTSVERGSLLTEESQTDRTCPVGQCFWG